jgi:CBS domain-containing protein
LRKIEEIEDGADTAMVDLTDVVTPGPWESGGSTETVDWLASLLRADGVNLSEVTAEQLRRGSPVYVEASADLVEVQRLMAFHHIRLLPVLRDGTLIGVVDLVQLAARDDLTA